MNYKIPIIPQNLNKHETILQIAEVLDSLSSVSDNIISCLDKRLVDTENQLSQISQRINTVTTKINALKGKKTATQVFSSSKYPASEVSRDYVSAFHDCLPIAVSENPVKQRHAYSSYEPLERLQFYHVNVSSDQKNKKLEGLGDIPGKVTYVNDLQLYNSGKNLYKNYTNASALRGPSNVQEDKSVEVLAEIGAPPLSISKRLNSTQSFTQDYFYAPQIGQVPALDVPVDLPDLPGIADNLHYENSLGPGIAPSTVISTPITDTLEDLPVIAPSDVDEINIPVSESLPLPPPPHISQIVPKDLPKPTIFEEQGKEPQELPEPVIEKPLDKDKNPVESILPLPNDLMRSSLMEAIRNAGGKAKLRSTDGTQEQKKSNISQGGDLMADLHNKLFMRRKGISGDKKPVENLDASSALGKISAMIPAPETTVRFESNSNDEDDWET